MNDTAKLKWEVHLTWETRKRAKESHDAKSGQHKPENTFCFVIR